MRKTNPDDIGRFLALLQHQAQRKALLYDGCQRELVPDETLRYAIEELGEIASAITRKRFGLAEVECIDLAHCAMLIWMALRKMDEKSRTSQSPL